jgi:uncharacterized protein YjbJ (UPF0337 family)
MSPGAQSEARPQAMIADGQGPQMNRDRIAGRWRQLKGIVRQRWSRLTANYAGVVAGKREHRLGQIQSAHGITKEASEKQLAEWLARQHKTDPIHK